jgi:hypothetical protein
MPQASGAMSSAIRQVQKDARKLLAGLHKEIDARERELGRLRDDALKLTRLIGGAEPAPSGGSRVNWAEVLPQLPKRFTASDVREIREVSVKRASEIFAGITRWIEAGLVKRKDRGQYERS